MLKVFVLLHMLYHADGTVEIQRLGSYPTDDACVLAWQVRALRDPGHSEDYFCSGLKR